MNSIFHYIIEAESEAPVDVDDLYRSAWALSACNRASLSMFFAALRQRDHSLLRPICWNVYLHYGQAHYDAAVKMIRGAPVSTTIDELEALGSNTITTPMRNVAFMRPDDTVRYPFDLNCAAAPSKLFTTRMDSIFVVSADPHKYGALEAAPCTPYSLAQMPELWTTGCIFDLTIDHAAAPCYEYLQKIVASKSAYEGRPKLVYVSGHVFDSLVALAKADDNGKSLRASRVEFDVTAFETFK